MSMTNEQIQALKAATEKLKEIGIIHNYSKSVAAQIAFEKAATLEAILSLLAEREADKKRIAELEGALSLASASFANERMRADALEARTLTVKLPEPFTKSMYGTPLYEHGDIVAMLAAAGITLDVGE